MITWIHNIVRIFIGLYAILTVIAVGVEINTSGFHPRTILYFIGSALLLIAAIKNEFIVLVGALIFMVIIAAITGYTTDTFDWKHIIVRIIISVIIIIVYIKTSPK